LRLKKKIVSGEVYSGREEENCKINEHKYALFGLLGPLMAILFVIIAIIFSPWFSWWNNALSDLGHSVQSEAAPWFNFGLMLSGFIMILYPLMVFKNHAKYTSYFLVIAGFSLQLIATFDEVYGLLHFLVSVLFFAALGLASASYVVEKRSVVAFVALVIGSASWLLYGAEIIDTGIAVPEAVSAIPVFVWMSLSAIKICLSKITI
jgi:hypothetical membrane protein